MRVGVVPAHETHRGMAPGQILSRNPQPAVALRPDRVDDLVVAGAQVLQRHVVAERDVAEVTDLIPGQQLRVDASDRLDGLVVRSHAVADQPVRRGQVVDHVDRDGVFALQQRLGREESGRPGTYDRNARR